MPYYKEKFLNDAVFCLRNANLTVEDQERVARIFGDNLQWSPNSIDTSQDLYIEDHTRHLDAILSRSSNSTILPWHMEHVFRKNPVVSGIWNMQLFTCDNNFGKTYFVDTAKLFNELNKDYKDFLLKVTLKPDQKNGFQDLKLVQKHRVTEENVIRFPFPLHNNFIFYKFDGEDIDDQIYNKYKEIYAFIDEKIRNDESIRLEQKWQQGDLIIVDLFKMAHAVTGGFTPDQRKFTGIFGAEKSWGV
ncbi:TauD/TfdA-like domain containing protein [uncultured Caudovirales phage]|uniref:TauD/TfdA-like domain containing protein n=1 Tax=uncultured Caudovirales phage TaxID=2100421 RepID=A0A6J7WSB5_9CAUD|nr:TauD/TfdA-like domain containing protein [uncultured Caudovirales phage]